MSPCGLGFADPSKLGSSVGCGVFSGISVSAEKYHDTARFTSSEDLADIHQRYGRFVE
jgi:hypothetical protein